MTITKQCTTCREDKALDEFHKAAQGKHGRKSKCKECHRAHRRSVHCPEKTRAYQLWHHYGITVEQYDAMMVEQKGRCLLCDDEMKRPNVDHCHDTGKVRGLLCPPCNRGLGIFRDRADVLDRAANYLRTSGTDKTPQPQ